MKILLTFVIFTCSIVQLVATEPSNETNSHGNDDEKRSKAKHDVDEINQKNHGLWRAEVNDRFALMEPDQKKKLAGSFTRRNNGNPNPPKNEQPNSDQPSDPQQSDNGTAPRVRRQISLPSSFDSRTKWPQCAPIIGNIRDQSNCGSCWAVSTGSVLTDRKCVAKVKTGQAVNPNSPSSWASEADVMTCSGGSADGDGCNGGWPYKAFNSMVTKGVLSGTNYTWNAGCKPYPFPSTGGPYSAIGCSPTCSTGSNDYSRTYMSSSTDLFDGSSTYAQQMMQEIYNNGPVVATMDVYEDFYYYASGVYSYTYGAFQGGHAVRIIGWGSLNGVNYWLAANSWGKNWGQQGLFMIRRGVNEVYIESEISYGAVNEVYIESEISYGTVKDTPSGAPIGKNITIKGSNGKYVCSNLGISPMMCDKQSPSTWEKFTVEDAGNDNICLKNSGKYVSSMTGQSAMTCDKSVCAEWEWFKWISNSDGTFSLKANVNGLYVSHEWGYNPMIANRQVLDIWEKFTYETVTW